MAEGHKVSEWVMFNVAKVLTLFKLNILTSLLHDNFLEIANKHAKQNKKPCYFNYQVKKLQSEMIRLSIKIVFHSLWRKITIVKLTGANMDVQHCLLLCSRFLMLCVHSSYGSLRQLAMDALGNLAAQVSGSDIHQLCVSAQSNQPVLALHIAFRNPSAANSGSLLLVLFSFQTVLYALMFVFPVCLYVG